MLHTSCYRVQRTAGARCAASNDEHIELIAALERFDLFAAQWKSALAFWWTLHGIVDLNTYANTVSPVRILQHYANVKLTTCGEFQRSRLHEAITEPTQALAAVTPNLNIRDDMLS